MKACRSAGHTKVICELPDTYAISDLSLPRTESSKNDRHRAGISDEHTKLRSNSAIHTVFARIERIIALPLRSFRSKADLSCLVQLPTT